MTEDSTAPVYSLDFFITNMAFSLYRFNYMLGWSNRVGCGLRFLWFGVAISKTTYNN